MAEWQDIATAPKDGTVVDLAILGQSLGLTSRVYHRATSCKWSGADKWWVTPNFKYVEGHPTHWMPLPPPPEAKL